MSAAALSLAAENPPNSQDLDRRLQRIGGAFPDIGSGGRVAMTPANGRNAALVLIPAFNESASIGWVVEEVRRVMREAPVLVVDDCSTDATIGAARQFGADVLPLPHHLGLGGCLQAGYRLAYQLGYDYVVRVDGDGQMDPQDIPRVLETLRSTGCQMVIGSRYLDGSNPHTSFLRGLGIRFFRLLLRPILGYPVRDPTSGFVGVNREALEVFSRSFPLEYPEIETLVVLRRRAFRFVEIPCRFRPRRAGQSTITASQSIYYMVHVLLGVLVNILKFGKQRWR